MQRCDITLDPEFRIAPVNPRLFGSFVEHLGRCVYGGIFEPSHPNADAEGFRQDVLELVRELGISVVRYPGGNFVSGYRWEDGVGPVASRPRRLDLAWRSVETNAFGLNEFMAWARRAGVEPMMAVNLGTRGIQEACDLLEYANHPGGTHWSDLRRAHGVPEPHDITLWCLGNEMDGPWQTGYKTAEEYGRLAAQTAKAMRQVDPRVRLVACGSSGDGMPTFGAWESTVLEHTFEDVDYISLHAYYEPVGGDHASFLASGAAMDRFIDGVVATADHVAARKHSRKKLMLSFDEWNVWYMSRPSARAEQEWPEAPRLLENVYTAEDAVVVGSLLMSLLRHSDRIGVACLAQLINVIAPIWAEPNRPAWRQTTFHPFALTARHARGEVLRVEPRTPIYETQRYGEVPIADAIATRDPESNAVTLFAVNRSETDPVRLTAGLRSLPPMRIVDHQVLGGEGLALTNAAETPERVTPRAGAGSAIEGETLTVPLPPVSWSMIRFAPAL